MKPQVRLNLEIEQKIEVIIFRCPWFLLVCRSHRYGYVVGSRGVVGLFKFFRRKVHGDLAAFALSESGDDVRA